MSGYCDCSCRDCFELAIGDEGEDAFCHECQEHGCEPNCGECRRPDAYGVYELSEDVDVDGRATRPAVAGELEAPIDAPALAVPRLPTFGDDR